MNLAVKNNQEKILLITMKNFSCVVRALWNLWKTRLSGTIFHIFVNYIRPYIRLYRPQERPLQGQKNNNSSFSHFWRRDYVKKITAVETKLPHQYVLKYIFLNRIKTAAKIFKVWKRNMKFTHTYSSGYFVTFKNYYLQIIILLRRILKKKRYKKRTWLTKKDVMPLRKYGSRSTKQKEKLLVDSECLKQPFLRTSHIRPKQWKIVHEYTLKSWYYKDTKCQETVGNFEL